MNRRTLLTATALLPVAGCATFENWLGMTPAQWATDLSDAAGWIPAIDAALAAMGNVPAATITEIETWGADIQTDAGKVATQTANVVAGTNAATYVQEACQTLTAIANVVGPLFPVSSPLVPVIDAFLALVPELLQAAGLTSATVGARIGASAPAYVPHTAYTLVQARAILHAKP